MREPLIIGGGPAGAAVATRIAVAGQGVTLLERHAEPTHKVCGDFLSGEAVAALQRLGLDPLCMGAAPIHAVRLINRRAVAEAALPFAAAGLSRRTLDEALLHLASQRGATLRRGIAVRALVQADAGFQVRTDAELLSASTIFLATGKHDLRGLARPSRPDGLLGVKMYYALAPDQSAALRDHIELYLLRGGYAGLQLVENQDAVLCMLLPSVRWRDAGTWHEMLHGLADDSPLLAHRLSGATPHLDRPLAIAGTPYGHLHRSDAVAPPGLFRVGDQACVVPSLVGDGIATALNSGVAAAEAWLRGADANAYHAEFARRARLPLRIASLVHGACLSPVTRPLIAAACRLWPGVMRTAASLTRVAYAA